MVCTILLSEFNVNLKTFKLNYGFNGYEAESEEVKFCEQM